VMAEKQAADERAMELEVAALASKKAKADAEAEKKAAEEAAIKARGEAIGGFVGGIFGSKGEDEVVGKAVDPAAVAPQPAARNERS
jgi:hypothetical protein